MKLNIIQRIREALKRRAEGAGSFLKHVKSELSLRRDWIMSEENRFYFAALAFLPFAGWLLPLYLKERDDFAQKQAKTGFWLAFLFTTALLMLFLVNVFSPKDWRVYRLAIVVLIYLVLFAYFGICAYGIHLCAREKKVFSLEGRSATLDQYIKLIDM